MAATTPWVLRPPKAQLQDAELRLFCFPQAGSGAWMYHQDDWMRLLPPGVEVMPVELPGRNSRVKEEPQTDMVALVAAAADALLPLLLEKPFAFFGHSMGAWVAFELTRELQRRGGPLPLAVYASANRSPTLAGQENDVDPVEMHRLPRDAFWRHFAARYGATPDLADKHVRAFAERQLRADFQVIETYRPALEPGYVLPCPLAALGGQQDPRYRLVQLEAWQEVAAEGGFHLQLFDGAHDYIATCRAELLGFLSADLARLLPALAAPAAQAAGNGPCSTVTTTAGTGAAGPAPATAAVGAVQAGGAAAVAAAQGSGGGALGNGAAKGGDNEEEGDELPISTHPSLRYPAEAQPPGAPALKAASAALLEAAAAQAAAEQRQQQQQQQQGPAMIGVQQEREVDASVHGAAGAIAGGASRAAFGVQAAPAQQQQAPGLPSMQRRESAGDAKAGGEALSAVVADERICAGLRREMRACCWWFG